MILFSRNWRQQNDPVIKQTFWLKYGQHMKCRWCLNNYKTVIFKMLKRVEEKYMTFFTSYRSCSVSQQSRYCRNGFCFRMYKKTNLLQLRWYCCTFVSNNETKFKNGDNKWTIGRQCENKSSQLLKIGLFIFNSVFQYTINIEPRTEINAVSSQRRWRYQRKLRLRCFAKCLFKYVIYNQVKLNTTS